MSKEIKSEVAPNLDLSKVEHYDGAPRQCERCEKGMYDGWTTEDADMYVCSKECLQEGFAEWNEITLQKAKDILKRWWNSGQESPYLEWELLTDKERKMVSGMYYTEWYDEENYWEL